MAGALPEFPPFEIDDLANAGPRWKKWVLRFEVLLLAMDVKDTAAEKLRKKALLMHYMGAACFDIYVTVKDDDDDYTAVKEKMNRYFIPKNNSEFERHLFRKVYQNEGENLDQFCTRLKQLSINCDFSAETCEQEIKMQMVEGVLSSKLRMKGMGKPMTLNAFMELGRTLELSNKQSKIVEEHLQSSRSEAVNYVKSKDNSRRPASSSTKSWKQGQGRPQKKNTPDESRDSHSSSTKLCYSCGGSYPHEGDCPAKSRRCHNCEKYGHYSKMCKSKKSGGGYSSGNSFRGKRKPVWNVRTKDESGSDYSLAVRQSSKASGMNKIPKVQVVVSGVVCSMYVDSGTTVDILDQKTYRHVCEKSQSELQLTTADTKLYPYGSTVPLPVSGMFMSTIKSDRTAKELDTKFYVVENATGNLLTFDTANELGIIEIVNAVSRGDSWRVSTTNAIINENKAVFQGLGKLKDFQLKLNIDDTVPSVHQKHRRVPFSTRSKVETAIKQLYDDDICENPVNTPTPWVSPIVVVPKPKDPESVRICVDMRAANKAIKREKHPMPTVHELIHDLNGCKVFTKLDLNQGYHQIELHPDSRYITTFSTHLGLHRYKRLNFGVNAASEKFQQIIEQVLEGLEGVRNLSDDIIIASVNDDEHEKQVRACLRRLEERGLTLNKKKCVFFQSSLEFFGNVFSEEGVSPDPRKVKAVLEASKPTDKKQVKSVLGMANYVQRYIPDLATMVKPLRDLTKQDTEFEWTSECEYAWSKLKDSLTSDTVMSYFDQKLETELVVDASPYGLGGILTQIHYSQSGEKEVNVLSYASRSLDDVESRYSQVEREALAVRWGVEHFHLYLYGNPFVVITDHKPLVSVFANVLAKPSPRIERWCLRLQQYNFKVVYRPGSTNPADYMSRHPIASTCARGRKVTEEYVNYVCESVCPKAVSVQDVIKSTQDDPMLQNVINCVINGQWYRFKGCEEVPSYEKIASELSVSESGLLLRGHRIVIPTCMRRKIVDLAHEGHQGLVKTKSLLRAKVWFPNMDILTDEVISNCSACAVVNKDERLHPLQMSVLPDRQWQTLSADFGGPYPSGHYCLVVIDEYSRFPVVEIVSSTSAKSVIPVLDKIFATHGVPDSLKTDNGPPFQSHEFRKFMEYCGIRHRKITPLWPRANAQAENFMKPLNKAIKSATAEGKSWRQELYKFLRNYRATPHVTTGKPPAELLFGCNIKVLLPEISVPIVDDDLRVRDAAKKAKQKWYADAKSTKPVSQLHIGDTVVVRQPKVNKLSTAYDTVPLTVVTVKGTMVTAKDTAHGTRVTKTRNASQFKKVVDREVKAPEVIVVDEEESENVQDEVVPELQAETVQDHLSPVQTRSCRSRRMPDRYKDFVLK